MKKKKICYIFLNFFIILLISGCGGGNGEKYGSFSLTTDPEGATIFLDNAEKGKSPLNLDRVPIGNYRMKAVKNLYKDLEQDVIIQENQTTTIKIALESASTPNEPTFRALRSRASR